MHVGAELCLRFHGLRGVMVRGKATHPGFAAVLKEADPLEAVAQPGQQPISSMPAAPQTVKVA